MTTQPTRKPRNGVALTAEGLGLAIQLVLVVIGVAYLFVEDDEVAENARLLSWCLLATVYLSCTALWLNVDLRARPHDAAVVQRMAAAPLLRWFSTVVTFSSSFVGLAAATTLILAADDEEHFVIYDLIAVWAMLASWAMFHWGYARIYYSSYHQRAIERPLRFPGDEDPRLVDFVYFAFTTGTSFATADVSVATTRMRWTVVWHSTFSFFFNALIIVLTMNTISGGFAGR